MDKKSKARSPAKRTAKAQKKTKEKPQSERFIETARSIGVDESGHEFEKAMMRIVPVRTRG
jgi:hypothetical protein